VYYFPVHVIAVIFIRLPSLIFYLTPVRLKPIFSDDFLQILITEKDMVNSFLAYVPYFEIIK
jgi:hypothetical protein